MANDGADPAEPGPSPPPASWPGRGGYVGHICPGKRMEIVAAPAALLPGCSLHAMAGTECELAVWRAARILAHLPQRGGAATA